jgi:hypothetical protein
MNKVIFFAVLLAGCRQELPDITPSFANLPSGHFQWSNASYAGLPPAQFTQQQVADEQNCHMMELQIAIPAPSCVARPPVNCSQYANQGIAGAYAAGRCAGMRNEPHCDYSAVDQAQRDRADMYQTCLSSRGWTKQWVTDAR